MNKNQAQLAALCQAVLVREQALLRAILTALQQCHRNLASNDPAAMAQAVEHCKVAASMIGQVHAHRDQFRQAAACILEVEPALVTLRLAAKHLPPAEASFVNRERQRLIALGEEIQRVHQGNAVIVWWCLDFVQRVFAAIQGNVIGSRYSAGGKAQAGSCGPLWQGQG